MNKTLLYSLAAAGAFFAAAAEAGVNQTNGRQGKISV